MVQGPTGRKDAASELAERISGKPRPPADEKAATDPISEMEAVIRKVDSMEAQDLLRASVRRLRANIEIQTREAESRLRGLDGVAGGSGGPTADVQARTDVLHDKLAANAIALLEKGVPPNVVAQYLSGGMVRDIPVGSSLGMSAGTSQGLTIKDIKDIFEMAKSEKGTDKELSEILKRMDDRLAAVERAASQPKTLPKSHVYRQDEKGIWVKEELEPGEAMIVPPAVQPNGGKSIEELKEEHRHAEVMARQKADQDYKEKVATTLSEIPERIGAGLAGQFHEAEQPAPTAPRAAPTVNLMKFKCPDTACSFEFQVPENTLSITCPKCGSIWEREKKA